MIELNEDGEYICEFCKMEIDNEEKGILRHQRICKGKEEADKNDRSVIIEDILEKSIYNHTAHTDVTLDMIDCEEKDLYYIEEIDLSGKGLIGIVNKKNIDLTDLVSLQSLNISKNEIRYLDFLEFFDNLKILDIENNLIESLSYLEHLKHLEVLNAGNNQISSISSLTKLTELKVLNIQKNKISYITSTLKILKELKALRVLSIKSNPFVEEIKGYKHVIIHKLKGLEKLDSEVISEVDSDLAKEFVVSNNMDKTWYSEKTEETNSPKEDMKYKEKENIVLDTANIQNVINFKGKTITKIQTHQGPSNRDKNKLVQNLSKEVRKNDKLASHINTVRTKDNKSSETEKLKSDITMLENCLKQKDVKINSLETQIENLLNITKQLEEQLECEKREKDQLRLNSKQIVTSKDKQIKIEK